VCVRARACVCVCVCVCVRACVRCVVLCVVPVGLIEAKHVCTHGWMDTYLTSKRRKRRDEEGGCGECHLSRVGVCHHTALITAERTSAAQNARDQVSVPSVNSDECAHA
jgi:hypothetical protein